jgi:branched-chain amino acid transport system permease protein
VNGSAFQGTGFPTPFHRFRFVFGTATFYGDHIVILVAVVSLMVGLGLFFRYTRIGIAVRASADNSDRASLLGIPVRRVSTVVWIIGGVCSGLGVFLGAPVVGLPLGGFIGPVLLLYGLAAAVVGRMESLPTCLFAGMAIGVIDQSAVYSQNRGDLSVAMMLPLILVALLAQRGRLSRAFDTGVSSFKALKEFRPVPSELRGVREVRIARAVGLAMAAGGLLSGPYIVGTNRANFASLVLLYAMVGISLVILTGWAGQISLGQFAFVGVGAAVAGGLASNHGSDFFFSLLVAGLVGAAVAMVIGLPALRVQGLFLGVVTLAFAATVQYYILDRRQFSWLLPKAYAQVRRPILWGRLDVTGDIAFYYVCLVFLVLMYLSARSLRATRSGRVFISVRDNVRAAQSYGINLARSRLAAFAISGFFAAVAGALLAYQQRSVDQGTFTMLASIDVFIFVVIGGLTTLPGALLGAIYYEGI